MQAPEVSARRYGALVLVLAANVAFGAGLFFHAFLYNFYLESLGFGEAAMGQAQALLTVGGLAMLLPSGTLVDRLGSTRVAAAGTALATAGLTATALAGGATAIFAASALTGLGTVAWRVATGPLLLQLAPPGMRSRVFGWNVGLLVMSGGLWYLLGGRAAESLGTGLAGLRATLLGGAAVSAIGTGIFLALAFRRDRRETIRPAPTAVAQEDTAWRPGVFAVLAMLVAVWMLGLALVTPFFNLFFVREAGWSIAATGALFAAGHLVAGLVVIGGSEIAQRRGTLAAFGGWVAVFAPVIWLLAVVRAAPALATAYVVQGMVSPATNALIDQMLLERAPPARRGTVSAWRNAATEASGAGGAAAGGLVLERAGFGPLFALAGAVGLAGGLTLAVALRAFIRRAPAGDGAARS